MDRNHKRQEDRMKTFLIGGLTLVIALMLSISVLPSEAAAREELPYTFFTPKSSSGTRILPSRTVTWETASR